MDYLKNLSKLLFQIEVTDGKGKAVSLDKAVASIVNLAATQNKKGKKAMLIGNGGSASIASHIATDLLKNANIAAVAFNDPSLLTCLSNDLGYEYVFQKPIEILARSGDVLFAISSSGKSVNILNAARIAKEKKCFIVTFSGFDKENPLRLMGTINFYVPSFSYGYVEIIHLAACHLIADSLTGHKTKRKK